MIAAAVVKMEYRRQCNCPRQGNVLTCRHRAGIKAVAYQAVHAEHTRYFRAKRDAVIFALTGEACGVNAERRYKLW